MYRICFFALLFLSSCLYSPMQTGAVSEQNRYNLSQLRVGMTEKQVIHLMGYPYQIEVYETEEESYDIWYYITKKTQMTQTKILPRNLTPVIFQDKILQGWGRKYYLHITEDETHIQRKEHEKKEQYTDDPDEWPKDEHRMVTPPPPPHVRKKEEKPKKPPKKKSEPSKKKPKKEKNDDDDYLWWQ